MRKFIFFIGLLFAIQFVSASVTGPPGELNTNTVEFVQPSINIDFVADFQVLVVPSDVGPIKFVEVEISPGIYCESISINNDFWMTSEYFEIGSGRVMKIPTYQTLKVDIKSPNLVREFDYTMNKFLAVGFVTA